METNNAGLAKIAKKLVAIMAECSFVAKNGVNSFHNYKYATAEDVLWRRTKQGLFLSPQEAESLGGYMKGA